jgi:hypothetical protein
MTTARKTTAPKTAAKPAETVEHEPQFAEFEYKGYTYKIPNDPQDVPMEVVYAETEYEIVEEIVGPDQWVEFRKTRPTIRAFRAFAELVFEAAGYKDDDAGN